MAVAEAVYATNIKSDDIDVMCLYFVQEEAGAVPEAFTVIPLCKTLLGRAKKLELAEKGGSVVSGWGVVGVVIGDDKQLPTTGNDPAFCGSLLERHILGSPCRSTTLLCSGRLPKDSTTVLSDLRYESLLVHGSHQRSRYTFPGATIKFLELGDDHLAEFTAHKSRDPKIRTSSVEAEAIVCLIRKLPTEVVVICAYSA